MLIMRTHTRSTHSAALVSLLMMPAVLMGMESEPVSAQTQPADGGSTRVIADSTAKIALAALRSASDTTNTVLSPWSIGNAMGMAAGGAGGRCADQISEALSLPPAPEAAEGFRTIVTAFDIAARGGPQGKDTRDGLFELTSANRLWSTRGVRLKDAYTNTLASSFQADFAGINPGSPQAAANEVNRWVSDKTQKRITQIVSAQDIPDRGVILTNAVYFNAKWPSPFEKNKTHEREFTLSGGTKIKTPMMHDSGMYAYAECDGFEALRIPYRGPFHMLIILPERGAVEKVVKSLKLAEVKPVATGREVILALPKFDTSSHTSVAPLLKSMGITDAFDPALADFTGMTDEKPTYIKDVIHAANVKVDEKGTEAAAATIATFGVASKPIGEKPKPIYFTVDRPFLFFIRHDESETVVFAGLIGNPRK